MIPAIILALALAAIGVNFVDWQFTGRKGQLMRLRSGDGIFGLAYLIAVVLSVICFFGVVPGDVVGVVVPIIVGINQVAIVLQRHR